jgi:hypothetical protein
MVVLLVLSFVGVVIVAYAVDRVWKARAQVRRLHNMNDRLTAATARADEQHEERAAEAEKSAELTAFMPAINRPPSSLPGMPARRKGRSGTGRDRAARPDSRPAARAARRPPRSAEHADPQP